jgi:hypothetical protein
LEPVFNPVVGRIWILAEGGLTSMMVLHDYVSKRIVPLQERTHPTWLYTGVNDITRLQCGDGFVLGGEALALVMWKLSPDPSSHDFFTPPASCQPLCVKHSITWALLLVVMDDVGIAQVQRGDQSRGVWIPGTGVVGGHGGAVSTSAPSKDKGLVVRVVHNEDDVLLQRRMRAASSGGSAVGGPPLAATAPLLDSSAVARATTPVGSSGCSAAGDAAVATRAAAKTEVADAAVAKKAADATAAVKKAVDDTTAVKKAADDAAVVKKAGDEAAAAKMATDDAVAAKKAADDAVTAGFGSVGGSRESGCA